MTPELDAIGKSRLGNRARMCNGWRYMPGMLLTDGTRLSKYDGRLRWTGFRGGSKVHVFAGIPDFTDPATLGCLLALVREAWGEPLLSVAWAGGRWYVVQRILRSVDALRWIDAATEAEALVAAMEAAP